jgi:short-subunit dehydrogenase
MDFKEKVFVITGGGNGLGREIALKLLSAGASVALVDIDQPGMDQTSALSGADSDRLSKHHLDLTDRKAVSVLPEKILAVHGSVDGLINNAGIIQPFIKINNLNYDTIEWVMNTNFYSAVYVTKAFLPHLLQRPEAWLVNISSMGGFLPVPGQGMYGASKAALKLFTEALHAELTGTNVHVTVVFPGGMDTEIAVHSGVDMETLRAKASGGGTFFNPLSPVKAAEIIIEGMIKERFQIHIGTDSKFMNLLYRFSPKFATKFIAKQMAALLED